MDDKILYIHSKVDKLDDRLDSVDKTLVVNTQLLADHIKRTNILESSVKEIESHVDFVRKLFKLIAWGVGVGLSILPLLMQ